MAQLDPNIALSAKPLTFSLGDALAQAQQQQAQRVQMQAVQQQMAERQKAAEIAEAKRKSDLVVQTLNGVNDEDSFQAGKQILTEALGPDVGSYLGEHYSPGRIKSIRTSHMSVHDFLTEQQNQFQQGQEERRTKAAEATSRARITAANTPKPAEPFTLGEGQVRYGADGSEIARGPEKPAPKVAEPKKYEVTVPGPKGEPVKKLFTEEEMAKGVPEYKPPVATGDSLVKVEHKDEATGRTVIEWLPKSQLAGRTFQKGVSATIDSRLASAEAVNQTGNDIIAKLADPKYAQTVGAVLGRYNSVRDFIGNPPPEFAELAGQIESYAIANMGVHGMRSVQGAGEIKKLLDQKHNPQSLVATIQGLNSFSQHFMENEGRPAPGAKTAPAAEGWTDVGGGVRIRQKP